MTPPPAEIEAIVRRAGLGSSKQSARLLRRMLAGLGDITPNEKHEVLEILCSIGVEHGWRELKRTIRSDLLARTSRPAQISLRRYLQGTLEWISRPCFDLEWASFTLAVEALRLDRVDPSQTKKRFLGEQPSTRLLAWFKKFPALAALWSVAIADWRNHVSEVLTRACSDERAIARVFFDSAAGGRIKNVWLGLSDRHLGGRSVALIEFEHGQVIYKPRSGTSEAAWGSLLRWMNGHGFQPRLRAARILRRKGYHWMEYVEAAACRDPAAVRRFYKRLGGLIAAAYLLNAVDCHRENLIAAGEDPVLVDLDALWQVSPLTKTQSPADLLYRTGFFPNSNPESLQSRSSALGKSATGTHRVLIGRRSQPPADFADEIIAGFLGGWRSLVGTPQRRSTFLRRAQHIRSQKRRWIYRATENYAAIIRASIQPGALISGAARVGLLRRLGARVSVRPNVVQAELKALARLDIPYFTKRSSGRMPPIRATPPAELSEAIERALDWTR